MAQTHTGLTGAATSIGEQPLKGLVDPAAMARIALGEALTNLMFAAGTDIADIKASVNWMYGPCPHLGISFNSDTSYHLRFTHTGLCLWTVMPPGVATAVCTA